MSEPLANLKPVYVFKGIPVTNLHFVKTNIQSKTFHYVLQHECARTVFDVQEASNNTKQHTL